MNDVAPQVIKFPSTNEDKEYVAKEFEKVAKYVILSILTYCFYYRYLEFQMYWVA